MSAFHRLVPLRTSGGFNIAGTTNMVLMKAAIQTRSKIGPPPRNGREHKVPRIRVETSHQCAHPEMEHGDWEKNTLRQEASGRFTAKPRQKEPVKIRRETRALTTAHARLHDDVPAGSTCRRQWHLQFCIGETRELRFFVDLKKNMGAMVHASEALACRTKTSADLRTARRFSVV